MSSRVFDGRIIHSAEIERIHKEVLDFKRIEANSQPMRELIEDLWPELANTAEGQLTDGSQTSSHRSRFWDRPGPRGLQTDLLTARTKKKQ